MNKIDQNLNTSKGLYCESFEKDNCGFGLIVNKFGKKTHILLQTALSALTKMKHRGAVSEDGLYGDGCGLLFKIDHDYYRNKINIKNISSNTEFATGLIFLDANPKIYNQQISMIHSIAKTYKMEIASIVDVPVNKQYLGESALAVCPYIAQIFIVAPVNIDKNYFEQQLFVYRRALELYFYDNSYFYMPSLSSKTIIYKGLMAPDNLSNFYLDLQDESLRTDLCIFHQRFSTNTTPKWELAQPFRYLAHNGEINTIKGNRNRINAYGNLLLDNLSEHHDVVLPITDHHFSDSCSLDHVTEALHLNGMSLQHSLRILIPPAWQNKEDMDADLRAFYEFYSMHIESWDGPAGIVSTDGRFALCILDRNGLRPVRWHENINGDIMIASEAGIYDTSIAVVAKGRVKPGEMIAIDTSTGMFLSSCDIETKLMHQHAYKKWLSINAESITRVHNTHIMTDFLEKNINRFAVKFNLYDEEKEIVIRSFAEHASEPVGSMGDDVPIAVLSDHKRSLYEYFRQQFSQVTNPAIDSLRESVVMSLKTMLGLRGNFTRPHAELAKRLVLNSPILSYTLYDQICHQLSAHIASISLNVSKSVILEDALQDLAIKVEKEINNNNYIIVLDDEDICDETYPVHALLATGYIYNYLAKKNKSIHANLVIKTATVRDAHACACLIGYGAMAVYPYFAYQMSNFLYDKGLLSVNSKVLARRNYRNGLNKGLKKIMSKMGISTVNSYRASQSFEIIGLHQEVVDACFYNTKSPISGLNFMHIYHQHLNQETEKFYQLGRYKFNINGEYHAYNPQVVIALQKALSSGQYKDYTVYKDLVNHRSCKMIRDFLRLKNTSESLSLEEVMPIEDIFKTFDSAAMSLGAISSETHEAIAQAMNELGGRSNSGEGGEDVNRFNTNKCSKIKQIASGRFGVTPEYLMSAEVIQIKIAQGAKPGEGGQLPGDKVNELIARLRFSIPGVTLISPPPHHDIYSIEDLAQLIFDLKQVNPRALISVKLVSESGVGTVAAGVVKAYADMITISGHDGGTGASPLSSIIYSGTPWEIGLTETHQTLVRNNLRKKIILQVDGGLKTGLDVIKAAILGAESFGFGTAPMIALGCKYLRICHLNNCATGVATQDEFLRAKYFRGTVDKLKNFFKFIALEVRYYLASVGVKSLKNLVGRVDLLETIKDVERYQLDLSHLLYDVNATNENQTYRKQPNKPFDQAVLARKILTQCIPSINKKESYAQSYTICNTDRSIGAMLSGYIADRYGNKGVSEQLDLTFNDSAGQSFGAFNVHGVNLTIVGEANDYVGKSMNGGKIVLIPPADSLYNGHDTPILGNTCLYGATGGKLYAYGHAGERFAVRNSGAVAVIDGAGDHCCEYMTGGVIVVLGNTGINFGAGMTGGIAYVLDTNNLFFNKYNNEFIQLYRIQSERMQVYQDILYHLIDEYYHATNSQKAKNILDNFQDYLCDFWLVSTADIDTNHILVEKQVYGV